MTAVLANLLNPKLTIFFFAFLPQVTGRQRLSYERAEYLFQQASAGHTLHQLRRGTRISLNPTTVAAQRQTSSTVPHNCTRTPSRSNDIMKLRPKAMTTGARARMPVLQDPRTQDFSYGPHRW